MSNIFNPDPRSVFNLPGAADPSEPTDPWSHRPSITIGIRLVDNGAIIYCNARNVGPQFNIPPESVATSIDQAVDRFRDMIQKVWPQSAK